MKKRLFILIFILITVLFSVAFSACSQTKPDGETLGKYYKIAADGTSDSLRWIELKENGRFSNETKLSGAYTVKGENITLTAAGEKTLVGTIKKGEIKLNDGEIYCKEGVTPSNFVRKEDVYYTVTFDTNGGTTIPSQNVKSGARAADPDQPTKKGFVFYGWYTDNTYSVKWNFKTNLVESDVTIYAKMVAEQGKITEITVKNGEKSLESKIDGDNVFLLAEQQISSVNLADAITLNDETATWKIYSDKKMQKELADKFLSLENGDNVFYIKTTSKDGFQTFSYILNAHRKHDVEISFFFDEKSETPLATLTVSTYTPIPSDALDNLSVTGYSVLGWKDRHENDVVLSEKGSVFTEKTSLYAVYKPNGYSVTYDANGGTTKATKQIVDYNADYTLEIPVREGYAFTGWTIGETLVTDATGKCLAPYSFSDEITVKAVWQINSYYVFVNNNDEAGSFVSSRKIGAGSVEYNLNYGKVMDVAADELVYHVPERQGYIFGGWFLSPDCEGTPYEFNEEIDKKTVLYAKWIDIGDATPLYGGTKKTISVPSATDENKYCAFYPLTDNSDSVAYLGTFPTIGYLYDDEKKLIASSSDGNELFSYEFERNKLYYMRFAGKYREGVTEIAINGTKTPDISGEIIDEKLNYSESVTLTVVPRPAPFVWLGWFSDGKKVSNDNDYSYTFNVPAKNAVLTPKWAKITATPSDEKAGTTSVPKKTLLIGEQVTVTASTNGGYVWLGWFNGDDALTEDKSFTYTFDATEKGANFTAKWVKLSLVNSDENAGTITSVDEIAFVQGETFSAMAVGNNGYAFLGWFINDEKVSQKDAFSYDFTVPDTDLTITARWGSITAVSSDETLGTVSFLENKPFLPDEDAEVTATGKDGSVWLGWFINGEKVSLDNSFTYKFSVPESDVALVAKWDKIVVNKSCDGGEIILPQKVILLGEKAELSATVNDGFAFLGWFDDSSDSIVCDKVDYTFTVSADNLRLSARWSFIRVEANMPEAGTFDLPKRAYTVGEKIRIDATTNDGYSFIGFYEKDERISKENESYLEITVGEASRAIVAKWAIDDAAAVSKNVNGGVVRSAVNVVANGKELTLTAIVYPDFGWLGWFIGETKISDGNDLSVTVPYPEQKTVYTAKFVKCETHVFDQNCKCTVCGRTIHDEVDCFCSRCGIGLHTKQDGGYCRHSDNIYMGFYPQTKVDDKILISYLNYKTDADSLNGWSSFDFKVNGAVSDYAFYTDAVVGETKYRGVYFNHYRPFNDTYDGIASQSNQDENGYYEKTVYWFKYEPIKWNLIYIFENFNIARIISELILDCGNFEKTSNEWFVEKFIPVAFDENVANVFVEHPYLDADVPSEFDMSSTHHGFNSDKKVADEKRIKRGTDYAKALGLFVTDKTGASDYLLFRGNDDDKQPVVLSDGSISEKDNRDADCGILPLLIIPLNKADVR